MSKRRREMMFPLIGLVGILVIIRVVLVLNSSDEEKETQAVVDSIADLSQNITPQEYQTHFIDQPGQHLLLDVRTPEEYAEGHIANSVNISLQTLAEHLDEVPKDQPVVLYCRSGNRSAQAAELLKEAGYTAVYDLGGIIDWQAAGYPIEK
jgi:rhodanese-related sulfurtransferase